MLPWLPSRCPLVPAFRSSDEGIIEAIHRIAQGLFASGSILWPTPTDDLLPHHLAALYSLTALLSLLMDPDFHDDDPDPNLCMASG